MNNSKKTIEVNRNIQDNSFIQETKNHLCQYALSDLEYMRNKKTIKLDNQSLVTSLIKQIHMRRIKNQKWSKDEVKEILRLDIITKAWIVQDTLFLIVDT